MQRGRAGALLGLAVLGCAARAAGCGARVWSMCLGMGRLKPPP